MPRFRVNNQQDTSAVRAYLDKLVEGKTYDVDITLHRVGRTMPQNRLLHLWYNCIARETGESSAAIKRYTKEQFLGGYAEVSLFGGTSYQLCSITSLDKEKMSLFMEQVQAWAATELDIILPTPEDLHFSAFAEQYR